MVRSLNFSRPPPRHGDRVGNHVIHGRHPAGAAIEKIHLDRRRPMGADEGAIAVEMPRQADQDVEAIRPHHGRNRRIVQSQRRTPALNRRPDLRRALIGLCHIGIANDFETMGIMVPEPRQKIAGDGMVAPQIRGEIADAQAPFGIGSAPAFGPGTGQWAIHLNEIPLGGEQRLRCLGGIIKPGQKQVAMNVHVTGRQLQGPQIASIRLGR